MINRTRIKAYAKIMHCKRKAIEQIPEEYRALVYAELIASYEWNIDMISKQYQKEVKMLLK